MAEVTIRRLKEGDQIECLFDGKPEKVLRSKAYGRTRWFIRTDHHDHLREADFPVVRL